jgi:hypothetical protein
MRKLALLGLSTSLLALVSALDNAQAEDTGPDSICFHCSWNIAESFQFPADCRSANWGRYLAGCKGACDAEDEDGTSQTIQAQAAACLKQLQGNDLTADPNASGGLNASTTQVGAALTADPAAVAQPNGH